MYIEAWKLQLGMCVTSYDGDDYVATTIRLAAYSFPASTLRRVITLNKAFYLVLSQQCCMMVCWLHEDLPHFYEVCMVRLYSPIFYNKAICHI